MDTGWEAPPPPTGPSPEEIAAQKQRRVMFAVIALAVFLFFSIPLQLLCISLCWKRRRRARRGEVEDRGDEEEGTARPPEMTERARVYTSSVSTASSTDADTDADAHSLSNSDVERPVTFSGSVLPRSAVHRIPAPPKLKGKGAGKNAKPIGPAEALGIDKDAYFRGSMPPRSSSSEDIIAAPAKIHVPFELNRTGHNASSSGGDEVPSPSTPSHVQHQETGINPWDCEHLPNAVIFPHLRESEMEVDGEGKNHDLAVQAPGSGTDKTPSAFTYDMRRPPTTYAFEDAPHSAGHDAGVTHHSPPYGSIDIPQSPAYGNTTSCLSPTNSVDAMSQSPTYSTDAIFHSPTYHTNIISQSPSSPGGSSSTTGKEPSQSIRGNSPYSRSSSEPTSSISQENDLGTIHETGESSNSYNPIELPTSTSYQSMMKFPSPSPEESRHFSDDQRLDRSRGASSTSATSPSGDSDTQNRVHQCEQCSLSFDTVGRLNTHINRKHRRRYNCEFCNKAFALKTDLERHLRTVHRKRHSSHVYRCTIPGCPIPTKDFPRKDNFERHVVRCRLRHLEQEGGVVE